MVKNLHLIGHFLYSAALLRKNSLSKISVYSEKYLCISTRNCLEILRAACVGQEKEPFQFFIFIEGRYEKEQLCCSLLQVSCISRAVGLHGPEILSKPYDSVINFEDEKPELLCQQTLSLHKLTVNGMFSLMKLEYNECLSGALACLFKDNKHFRFTLCLSDIPDYHLFLSK